MTALSVVPTLRHHAPENRPLEGFSALSCESRVSLFTPGTCPNNRDHRTDAEAPQFGQLTAIKA